MISRLTIEETRLGQSEKSESAAFASVGRQPAKNSGKKLEKTGTCHYCHKAGHWIRDCRKRKAASVKQTSDKGEALVGEALSSIENNETVNAEWYMDSGATDHMSNQRAWFATYSEFKEEMSVRIGNGKLIPAIGSGDVNILAFDGKEWKRKHLSNVLYVPNLTYNLFSLGATLDKGITYQSDNRVCKLIKNKSVVAVGERKNKLFQMKFKVIKNRNEFQANVATHNSLLTWHKRLAHQNVIQVKKILNNSRTVFQNQDFRCEDCILGKMHRLPFPKSESKSVRLGELVHADLCGPMQENSLGGARYLLLLKDDYSHWRTLYFIKQKTETTHCLEDFFRKTNKHLDRGIEYLRTDNGLEFVNQEIDDLTHRFGITHQKTVPYTPEQNGAIERENRTVIELARTSLHASGLPIKMWAEAINYAVYTLNRTGTSSSKDVSPSELWLKRKPDITSLKIFGEEVYVHIPKEKRRKWDVKAEIGNFVGYDENTKGYRVWLPEKDQVKIYRDVVFTGKQCKYNLIEKPSLDEPAEISFNYHANDDTVDSDEGEQRHPAIQCSSQATDEDSDGTEDDLQNIAEKKEIGNDKQNSQKGLRNRGSIKPPIRYRDACISIVNYEEPETYEEAITSNEADKWKKAMDEEIDSLRRNQTWTLVNPPQDQQVIDNRWIYKIKQDCDGSAKRFKARLVARGFKQIAGVDYHETFSPVTRFDSIRIILSVAASKNMYLQQFDVKTAFLYGEIDETILYASTERICRWH